jgi:hypothetical protein
VTVVGVCAQCGDDIEFSLCSCVDLELDRLMDEPTAADAERDAEEQEPTP